MDMLATSIGAGKAGIEPAPRLFLRPLTQRPAATNALQHANLACMRESTFTGLFNISRTRSYGKERSDNLYTHSDLGLVY